MKRNTILIIIISFIIICVAFIIGMKVLNKNNTNPNNKEEPTSPYIKTFKNFTFDTLNEVEYQKLDDNQFELKTDKWHAYLEPMFDEYDYVLSYPLCTKKMFDDMKYKTGDLKKNDGDERKYIIFNILDNGENNLIAFYKINSKYVMFVSLVNNDNSLNEDGLNQVFKVLNTVKYNNEKKYQYHQYKSDLYHQCHDIEKYDQQTD